jgi:hypothetical protein
MPPIEHIIRIIDFLQFDQLFSVYPKHFICLELMFYFFVRLKPIILIKSQLTNIIGIHSNTFILNCSPSLANHLICRSIKCSYFLINLWISPSHQKFCIVIVSSICKSCCLQAKMKRLDYIYDICELKYLRN